MSNEEIVAAARIELAKKSQTSEARKEFKLAYLKFQLDDGELYVQLEGRVHHAYLACLVAGMSHEEISGLQQNWTKLLYAGHFRRTE